MITAGTRYSANCFLTRIPETVRVSVMSYADQAMQQPGLENPYQIFPHNFK